MSSRKQKDREAPPQPTDFADRMIALQRKNHPPRTRDRPPPTDKPISPRRTPHVVVSRPSDADPDDFSRRLKISSSPRQPSKHPHQSKLFNPETDPIPMRHTAEPESISDSTSSSYVPRAGPSGTNTSPARTHPREPPGAPRQLFDHRKDDPVRFSVLARPGRPSPTPKSSGEYVSASSTSSYAHSITSSNFTLSSNTTDGSSASSALFEGRPQNDESGNNAFAVQLKRLYRGISALETKILNEETDDAPEESRVVLKGRGTEPSEEDAERQKWRKLITDHKRLAEMMHNLLDISLAPSVPASLRNIPTKYNIIIRLWTHAFHRLLESLRRASFSSPLALEHLQDFIYYAYTFYTGLLEDQTLRPFRSGWLEALGDLARYRMAVAAMVTGGAGAHSALTTAAVSKAAAAAATEEPEPASPKPSSAKSISDRPAARIDDSPSPSVGLAAARLLDVEPEKERWRGIARDWYASGLADTPGTGKLHHHLGLLSREIEREELRAVYHFVKSMTTLHPFPTSRESVLPIWSPAAQARRALPDAHATELFVLLHGMLFTNIQLDDFAPTLARFLERLQIEGAEEREWTMMAVVNIGAVLEYGRPNGVLKKAGGIGGREGVPGGPTVAGLRLAKRGPAVEDVEQKKMEVDEGDEEMKSPILASAAQTSPAMSDAAAASAHEQPASLKLALQLTFAMLTQVLRAPTRKASAFARPALNPYLTVLLTFLATVLKHGPALVVLERAVPWGALAAFFEDGGVPRRVLAAQGQGGERWTMLTTGCAPPLQEDWCLRGMEWVGRKLYERGFWKSGEERRAELEVLDAGEVVEVTDGIIEDEDGEEDGERPQSEMDKRWVRIVRCGISIAGVVEGFKWEGMRQWRVEGVLEQKVKRWAEEDRMEGEEEDRRRRGRRWSDDAMDVDDEEAAAAAEDLSEDESQEDDNDTEEVKALKARRRYLRSLLQSGAVPVPPPPRRPRPRGSRKETAVRPALHIVPGYTVLVIDTNILLSSLSMFSSVVESLWWTVVVPLPVIMELDGLSANTSQLGDAAKAAMEYITKHIRQSSTSLKVQTSKGNYLTTLSVRSEQVDFDDSTSWERSMDDLILKAAIWQDEHWVDRSAMLKDDGVTRETTGAVKVVLLSFDRNLRLKARSRQLPAASETDLASILATGP